MDTLFREVLHLINLNSFATFVKKQDFPTVLTGKDAEKVGFTSLASEMCFSPVKNATSDGIALQAKGTHPGVAASGKPESITFGFFS